MHPRHINSLNPFQKCSPGSAAWLSFLDFYSSFRRKTTAVPTCRFAKARSLAGVASTFAHRATLDTSLRYLAYAKAKNDIDVVLCILLALDLYMSPPAKRHILQSISFTFHIMKVIPCPVLRDSNQRPTTQKKYGKPGRWELITWRVLNMWIGCLR